MIPFDSRAPRASSASISVSNDAIVITPSSVRGLAASGPSEERDAARTHGQGDRCPRRGTYVALQGGRRRAIRPREHEVTLYGAEADGSVHREACLGRERELDVPARHPQRMLALGQRTPHDDASTHHVRL